MLMKIWMFRNSSYCVPTLNIRLREKEATKYFLINVLGLKNPETFSTGP